MRKFIIIAGSLLLTLAAYVGLLAGYGYLSAQGVDHQSRAYGDAVAPKIFSEWTQEQILAEFDEEGLKVTGPAEITKMHEYTNSQFGAFKEKVDSAGRANVRIDYFFRKTVTAVYKAQLKFEKGDAIVTLSLIRRGNDWKILGINITEQIIKK